MDRFSGMSPGNEPYELPTSVEIDARIRAYLSPKSHTNHRSTIQHCDALAGYWSEISTSAVNSTRSPYLNSRISNGERDWFVTIGRDAPLEILHAYDKFIDADPAIDGGLYDRMLTVYEYFYLQRPRGISTAKIHKVLYVMFPEIFPILDSRLIKLLKVNAVLAAQELQERRSSPDRGAVNYWEAIRQLLLESQDTISWIRDELLCDEDWFVSEAAESLTDLRFLDMVLWSSNA